MTINPGWARANLDIRLASEMDADDIWEKIERHMKKHEFNNVEMKLTVWKANTSKSSVNTNIAKAWRNTIKNAGFNDPIIYPMGAGTGPYMYCTTPPLNLAAASAGSLSMPSHHAHAPNEYITTEEYINI